MDTQILQDLGLTNAEIKVYIALLELGSSTAGPILEKSGLQNSVTHRALNSLIEKSLINFILEGQRKIYQATNPEHFYNYIDDKKKKFAEILPELKQKQNIAQKQETATVYRGIRGIREVYYTLINAKAKEYLTFGGGEQTIKVMGLSFWNNLHVKRVANKLPSRQVFDETVRPHGKEILAQPITKVRFIPKEFAQFQETIIVGDLVGIAVFTENPYAFLISDKAVAEGYKKNFELLWNSAK